MEGSRKRKASNATPTSAEGSASKKLRLLVRSLSFIVFAMDTRAGPALFQCVIWRARRRREVVSERGLEWEDERGAVATLKVSSMDWHQFVHLRHPPHDGRHHPANTGLLVRAPELT